MYQNPNTLCKKDDNLPNKVVVLGSSFLICFSLGFSACATIFVSFTSGITFFSSFFDSTSLSLWGFEIIAFCSTLIGVGEETFFLLYTSLGLRTSCFLVELLVDDLLADKDKLLVAFLVLDSGTGAAKVLFLLAILVWFAAFWVVLLLEL